MNAYSTFNKFLVSGVINTGTTYLIYFFLVLYGAHYNLALLTCYVVGIGIGFYINRKWVFVNADHQSWRVHAGRYLAGVAVVFFVNLLILNALVKSGICGELMGQVYAVIFTTLLNYGLQKRWVFR